MQETVTDTGTVKWFDAQRGYGFITRDNSEDVFVHLSDVQGKKALTAGQRVAFEVARGEKGPKAVNVLPVT